MTVTPEMKASIAFEGALERGDRHGADPEARTRIDDLETPLDIAEAHSPRALAAMREWRAQK